ncbi:medium chain dehydrogenase/reductase family protein [Deinococcus altitudinis]|uniref:medium chain dehydrogenase/reductase family protein n=1 Tax=Deinococcus altitudinis TaxID=468914 RepID=UPI003892A9AA
MSVQNLSMVITRPGGPEVLQPLVSTLPEPGPGEVRLRVLAAGVSYGDVMMRLGNVPGGPKQPYAPGYDVVGEVEALGEGVTGLQIGTCVAWMGARGGYTRFCNVQAAHLVAVPDGLDPVVAGAAALNYVTAYQLLHRAARVNAGQSVLVQAAAGGVGTALLDLGREAGLTLFGTASAGKLETVREFGAQALDYRLEDVPGRVRTLSGGGVNAAFDAVGGASFSRSSAALSRGGRLVVYGFGPAVTRGGRAALLGSFLRVVGLQLQPDGKSVGFHFVDTARHQDWIREDLSAVFALLSAGRLQPLISDRLPLSSAAEAQRRLEAGEVRGKLVLVPD